MMKIRKSFWLPFRAGLSVKLAALILLGMMAVRPAQAADWKYVNCTAAQKATGVNTQKTSLSWMDKLQSAMPKVKTQKPPASTVFNTWMGAANADSKMMSGAFSSIQGYLNNAKVTGDCQNTAVCMAHPTAIAYTTTDTAATPLTVHFCPLFFTEPANVQANTIVHELAHRASNLIIDQIMPPGALDAGQGAYGAANVQWLAANQPAMAVKNADNYSYLAEMMFPVKLN